MEVFEATNTTNNSIAFFSIALSIISLLIMLYIIRNPPATIQKKFQPLLQLLLFIVFLIGACTAIFSMWTNQKLGPVTVTAEYIETPRGKVNWKSIDRIYIHQDRQLSPLNAQEYGEVIRFLMIVEQQDNRTHALSEENYDIDGIGAAIQANRPKN